LCAQGEWHAITLDNIDMSSVVDDVSLPAPSSVSRRYEEFKKKNYEEFKKKFKEKQPVLPAEDIASDFTEGHAVAVDMHTQQVYDDAE
jgi:hypothetical protein